MEKYFELKDFIDFLESLKENERKVLYTESMEDGSIENYSFMKIDFVGNTIILYDSPDKCSIGIIQDTPISPWQDYAELVFEDFSMNDEYKIY